MANKEKLTGALAVASNTYGSPTGYGQQTKFLIDKLLQTGFKVANFSNFGMQGKIEDVKTPYGKFTHYPMGYTQYSADSLPIWFKDFSSHHPALKSAMITLYDQWVYNDMQFEGDIFAWTPLDHVTLPPNVAKFLVRNNVTPITMSPHGQRLLERAGIESRYIPHAIDTKVMKPTEQVFGKPVRDYLGVPADAFLVGMVAANKANGLVHRKAFAEQFMAFSLFVKDTPNAYLYVHAEPSNAFGGFQLVQLARACGIPNENIIFLNPDTNRVGYPEEYLAGVYTACDVMLQVSYGEGFGIPTIEAQACGTRVITSNWAAQQDFASDDSWLVDGQPFWDEPQQSFYHLPLISSILGALKLAYAEPRGISQVSIDFAKQFDIERVWNWYWMPFLREYFNAS